MSLTSKAQAYDVLVRELFRLLDIKDYGCWNDTVGEDKDG